MASETSRLRIKKVGDVSQIEFIDRNILDEANIQHIGEEIASIIEASPKPKRAARKRAPKPPEQGELPKPAPRRRAAKPKTGAENGVPTAIERASERVREAVQADSGDEAA